MTEDEAFIRAIVDSPGDDTPRLVYADWLDDRDDPRGPYLRAEHEAVATGDIARLRELAIGLDPVWVARVSLPPIGICIEVGELGELVDCCPVDVSDISAAEHRLRITLSADYRAFLLNYNPRLIRREWYLQNGETVYAHNDLAFYPLVPGLNPHRGTLVYEAEGHQHWVSDPRSYRGGVRDPRVAEVLLRYIPIGYSEWAEQGMLLGMKEPIVGFVNFFYADSYLSADYLEQMPRRQDRSFAEFLHQSLRDGLGEFIVPDRHQDDLDEQTHPPPPYTPGDYGDNIPF